MQSNDVFISYRRSASEADAYSLFQGLKLRGINAFYDSLSIKEGKWLEIIKRQIAARPYFVLFLAPGTLERCADPDDVLRQEILEAVHLERRIILLYTTTFDWNDLKKYLPDAVAEVLLARQGLEWTNKPRFQEANFDDLQNNYLLLREFEPIQELGSDQKLLKQNQAKIEAQLPPPPAPPSNPITTRPNNPPRRLAGIVIVSAAAILGVFLLVPYVVQVFTSPTQTATATATGTATATVPPTYTATSTNTYTPTLTPSLTNSATNMATTEAVSFCIAGRTAAILANSTVTATPVFLRKSPDGTQAAFATYSVQQPGTRLILLDEPPRTINGQVWCKVRLEALNFSATVGWVEQHSLMTAPLVTATRGYTPAPSVPPTVSTISVAPGISPTVAATRTPIPPQPTTTPKSPPTRTPIPTYSS
jgi:hypothetical protein